MFIAITTGRRSCHGVSSGPARSNRPIRAATVMANGMPTRPLTTAAMPIGKSKAHRGEPAPDKVTLQRWQPHPAVICPQDVGNHNKREQRTH